jgi:hypothetical protein
MIAVTSNSCKVCQLLTEKGADLEIKDKDGHTAIDLAKNLKQFSDEINSLGDQVIDAEAKTDIAKLETIQALAVAKKALASNSVANDAVCMFCMDAPKAYAFIPCGHKTYCLLCHVDHRVMNLVVCPYCNVRITGTLRI